MFAWFHLKILNKILTTRFFFRVKKVKGEVAESVPIKCLDEDQFKTSQNLSKDSKRMVRNNMRYFKFMHMCQQDLLDSSLNIH